LWYNIPIALTSVVAHILAIEPMLFVIVTSVDLAKSLLEAWARFSEMFICPKLKQLLILFSIEIQAKILL